MDNVALLVIDVQDSFRVGPRWAHRDNPAFERNVAALVQRFRAAERPVIWFLHTDADPGFRESDPEVRLMQGFAPRSGEPLFRKTTRNCFTSTPLQPWLLQRGVRRLVVCGATTEQCCETTTRVGADLGFDMDYVTEATFTFPIGALSCEAIRERTEAVLRDRFARIRTVAEVLKEP